MRPPIVLGPNAMGAKGTLPQPLAGAGRRVLGFLAGLPVPVPVFAPNVPVQLIHEHDVGQALLQCVLGAGPPGAYNIAADDILAGADIVRELGLAPLAVPGRLVHGAARAISALPRPGFAPPAAEWVEAASHPAIMDTTKAKAELGWRPEYSAVQALRATLDGGEAGKGRT
ncbi:MAG: hypothetical protein JO244_14165 [Solirubrobacterales bacterium]|nr:hypothetical protein [Solirubrobacterales bacterium]